MFFAILKSKIHRAVVTETNLDYIGSITIDELLLEAAGIYPYEKVHVWNLTNGSRIITYAISGERNSGIICLNGAAAHLNKVGDRVIIASFAYLNKDEVKNFRPIIVTVDNNNKILDIIK